MRKSLIAAATLVALGLVGCQKESPSTETASSVAATESAAATDSAAAELAAMTDAQKQAYAMGASMGLFVKTRSDQMAELGGEMDIDALMSGFSDTIKNSSKMTDDEVRQFTQAGEQAMQALQQAKNQAMAAENIEAGKAFLAQNAEKEGVTTTESGLQYEVVTAGEGASPTAVDTVKVHYEGTLLDGTVFDSSYQRGEPIEFPLNRVISGWTEGVQLMKEGGKYRFYIPSELAYGERATGKITPNSTLIFDVELLQVIKAEEKPAE